MNLKWNACSIVAMWVHMAQGLSVHFTNPHPFHVALGRELVLEAFIEKIPVEKIFMVAWECNTAAGSRRLATWQGDPGKTQGPRISIEKGGATLKISGVRDSDFGRYTITVTDQDGTQTFSEKDVSKSEEPPKASVKLQCDVSGERAQWDSPVITWLVDGVEVTNETSNISDAGSKLHLQEAKGHNYTCISNSSLGISVAHFIIPEYDKPQHRTAAISIVLGVVLSIVLLAIGILWYRSRRRKQLI
ncbi:hypothetical protein AALO_G00171960 [Alosa alosa]|uniref:Ig-like domain-containing protein n=1 Tax=Alosa alosa TaxID=278164 RepID=A0AAV6G7C3_9TELE|nr:uncharacterized protein LOC125306071 [Alosa alosa]KAG5270760.1 hypothetical protein AALO_G00171960 [Alosa alosa]